MHKLYTGLALVAVAAASFAIGRATSGPMTSAALTSDNVASIDVFRLQSNSRGLPELHVDTPY